MLHRLVAYELPPVLYQADAAAQADFLDELAVPEAHVARDKAVLYHADAAHPTHNTRCTRAWCAVGQGLPLPTVRGRERVNFNACVPTQVLLDETSRVNAQGTQRLYEQYWLCTPIKPAPTSSVTTPATTKTRTYGLGWPINRFTKCFYLSIRPI